MKKILLITLFSIVSNLMHSQYYNNHKIEDLLIEAKKGNEIAQHFLADAYFRGKGVEQNYKQAFYWYNLIQANGKITFAKGEACSHLGCMYYNGDGVSKNDKNAFYFYKKGAEMGNSDAQRELGILYYNGIGVNKSLIDSIYWIKKACENKNNKACELLNTLKKHNPKLFN